MLSLTVATSVRHRLPWLLVGLVGGVLIAGIIGRFEATLQEHLVLAAFIPLVVYMAGAVGTQMEAFIIRDLAIHPGLPFIPDENIDYGRLLAKCPGCAAELPIQWDKRKGLLEKRRPHPVDKPARFDVRHQGSGLEIRVPWIRIKYFFMAPGALLLIGFTLYWIIPSLDRSAWETVAVLMVPCAWGLFQIYLALAGLLNSTHLRIGHGELAVAHGPVPFPGVRLKTWDVQQVYCIKRVRRSRSGTVFASYIHSVCGYPRRFPQTTARRPRWPRGSLVPGAGD